MKIPPEARLMIETRWFTAIASPRNRDARKKKAHFHCENSVNVDGEGL